MPGEARPPLTQSHAASTPPEGVDGVSTTDIVTSTSAEPPRPTPARRRRLFVLLAVVAVLAYASDQLTKAIALDVLADGEPRPFLGDVLRFQLIGNPGAALSLGANNTWVMTGIALAVLAAIIFVARNLGSWAWALALGLLLGAALGNLTDRFARPPGGGQGRVVDFIDYNQWFIGNVADIWIVGAAALIVILALVGIGVDGRREHGKHAAHETQDTQGAATSEAEAGDRDDA
jgi:signal peptidase II